MSDDRREAAILADLDALAEIGQGVDALDGLGRCGMPPGAFATFMSLEKPTRRLVLRLLEGNVPDDVFDELDAHPAGRSIAQFVLTLPAYVNVPDEDPDGLAGGAW